MGAIKASITVAKTSKRYEFGGCLQDSSGSSHPPENINERRGNRKFNSADAAASTSLDQPGITAEGFWRRSDEGRRSIFVLKSLERAEIDCRAGMLPLQRDFLLR